MSSPENTRPQYTGASYVRHSVSSIVFGFTLNNVRFSIVAASPNDEAGEALVPADYNFDDSIEGRILDEILDLSVHDGDGPWHTAKQQATRRLKKQLADLAADASSTPPTYTLQILSEGDKLTCRTLDDFTGILERHPPVPKESLRAVELDLDTTDLLVVKPSHVILVRHLHHLVWKVTVDGEELICKASLDLFEHASSWGQVEGIIQSHWGVIGILLSYIPHKYHSLHALLTSVEEGTAAPSEAAPSLRQKWARQIRETLAGLHGLGILWRDLKTHNVLINNNGDAVVLDFGGGNTVGWVDNDKYATMEGEEQGLLKIMEALGIQA
ncbi:hypothetical protein C8A01DRAFT_42963 [Parachaetomium inaequale]|uniref:Protein kinase domain-containing protein n=1 Tax=Parachaetomium inaequale TaxID=2588326 RepID=A0AAN6PS49_9PEZI|nr:hypothetical protein C8A01DRAFT_42963 [Parachaetomium inaequale]